MQFSFIFNAGTAEGVLGFTEVYIDEGRHARSLLVNCAGGAGVGKLLLNKVKLASNNYS